MKTTAVIFIGAMVLPIANYAVAKLLDVVFAGIDGAVTFNREGWAVIIVGLITYAAIAVFVSKWVADNTSKHCKCGEHPLARPEQQEEA